MELLAFQGRLRTVELARPTDWCIMWCFIASDEIRPYFEAEQHNKKLNLNVLLLVSDSIVYSSANEQIRHGRNCVLYISFTERIMPTVSICSNETE
jgi:hypothetical protein